MNTLPPMPNMLNSPDELDAKLSKFYHAHTPKSWPAAPQAELAEPATVAYTPNVHHARLTLAASILALFGFAFSLSPATNKPDLKGNAPSSIDIREAQADGKMLQPKPHHLKRD